MTSSSTTDWMVAEAEAYVAAQRRRAEAQRTRRLKARTVAEPTVRAVDPKTVAVSLCGNRGRGREMIVDRDVWREVSARLGTRWVIEPRKGTSGGLCVCVEGTDPVVPMDRELMEVRKGELLFHHNRDITDLRLANLFTVDAVVAIRFDYSDNRLPRLPRVADADTTDTGTTLDAREPPSDKPSRARRKAVPAPPPKPAGPYVLLEDEALCVSIPLFGKHAAGRRATLDLVDWKKVKEVAGEDWVVRETSSGGPSVISYHKRARMLAGDRDGSAALLVLSRFVAGAGAGEVVSFRDGDPFNIRRTNLVITDRGEFWEAHRAPPFGQAAPPLLPYDVALDGPPRA